MKKIFFAIPIIVLFLASCSTIVTESIPVSKVVKIPDTGKDELYIRANNWMVQTFNNAESVIQFSDKEAGTLSGRYLLGRVMHQDVRPNDFAFAVIKIDTKEEAARITITPESFSYIQGNAYTLYTQEDMQRDVADLITRFETAMLKAEDDW